MIDESTPFAICTAPKRNSLHWSQGTITWGELVGWLDAPGTRKEAGNYLLGTLTETTVQHTDKAGKPKGDTCTNLHRRKQAVVSRSAITLDVDHPVDGWAETLELVWGHAGIIHTTYSSTPDAPRYRMIVPTDREMAPDEYVAAAQALMQRLGADQFDPSTSEAERYMFRPAASSPDSWWATVLQGDPVPVDDLLGEWQEDLSQLPVPRSAGKNKRDPYALEGVVGAFNRAYDDWDLLIEEYELPYEKVAEDRYHLVGARSQAGMGPVAGMDGLVFSHHANDPAGGRACSAFDLVRLHRFGDLDENTSPQTPIVKLPSHAAMVELAAVDARVTAAVVGLDFDVVTDPDTGSVATADVTAAPDAWKMQLARASRTQKVLPSVGNRDLIRDHDAVLAQVCFNELTLNLEWTSPPPWRALTPVTTAVTATDRWEVADYLEREYGLDLPKTRVDAMLDIAAGRRRVNPVRDYLQALQWDGTPRVETCLPGVKPTVYTRLVARKVLVAAVARMFDPGCKWDHTLVLYGTEGLGKSWWIDRLSRGYSSSMGAIGDKDTLLTMQRSWIVVSDEGHSLRKGDADVQKEFLTRTADVFRMPYDRETLVHPRHCVIWSTTNDETFLRRQEGNRRFLIVRCEEKVDFGAMTDAYIDQLWAEAVHLYRQGEPLYLGATEAEQAAAEREQYVEEDALGGLIHEYLERRVPEDWWSRSPDDRVRWLESADQGWEAPGTHRIDQVCSTQVWVEALRRRVGDHRRTDLLEITNALKRIPGWAPAGPRRRVPGYGPQTVFTRVAE